MFKLVILEGARGTGKSTVAFKLRQSLKDSTLINFTGFNKDGEEGLEKIKNYYRGWFTLFRNFKWKVDEQVIICDRFFPSEKVFSSLYKEYDFKEAFENFSRLLPTLADEVYLFNFIITDQDELKERLIRDKVPFGKAEENTTETLRQQSVYSRVIEEIKQIELSTHHENSIRYITMDTTGMNQEEIFKQVINHINQIK